ncbi:pyridoxal phosphate-dependent decarboxylase family protein [Flagellimonas allohymeniacidonis]|uniref:Pyridoxal-dependent decarboxylase n=1 Tax=Flagellimonas allohymeniacidonis TaxID=2517819 RepID=A0A4Q8QL67_9FLAO|nr:pyridoxal-dependent decarboxylase [Allomuricauda hymeniacidonis]TAI49573.1 pyridoxal-dependent decarboxylase [Allomuricauda hymeniacidonis]
MDRPNFDLSEKERMGLIRLLLANLGQYYNGTDKLKVSRQANREEVRSLVLSNDFENPLDFKHSLSNVLKGLTEYGLHTPHPRYFGLFNPRTSFASILADVVTAVFNPQLAMWSHAPYAVELEYQLVQQFGRKFGYSQDVGGTFCTGGAEANLTAMVMALNHAFPDYGKSGIQGIKQPPLLYCSRETHHSILKAARVCGLGSNAIVPIDTDDRYRIDLELLKSRLESDIASGMAPFMIIGTAGTTGYGAIDDLEGLSAIAGKFGIWFHVDAAFGGALKFSAKQEKYLRGMNNGDSITFDLHKWLSVPMGASLFLTSRPELQGRTFSARTEYMPKDSKIAHGSFPDPYVNSIQWSRRFIGLKIYMALSFHGWKALEEQVDHHLELAEHLRERLLATGWIIKNHTVLPIVLFSHSYFDEDGAFARQLCDEIVHSGTFWISVYPVQGVNALRACITNYASSKEDVEALVKLMNIYVEKYMGNRPAKKSVGQQGSI